jgi:hypothetical protein
MGFDDDWMDLNGDGEIDVRRRNAVHKQGRT